jgi:hypothetical protein
VLSRIAAVEKTMLEAMEMDLVTYTPCGQWIWPEGYTATSRVISKGRTGVFNCNLYQPPDFDPNMKVISVGDI